MKVAGLAAALGACLPSMAATRAALSFSHGDWELRCDNTRTCRAAGYQAESGDSQPVSMLVTRAAGPRTLPQVSLQVDHEEPLKGKLDFTVGKLTLRGLANEAAEFTAAQVSAVLPELLKNEEAVVQAGGRRWTLSLAGLNAVLLKMDEAQGRLNTPAALVRRGDKAESSVLPALPIPVVRNVLPAAPRATDAANAPAIAKTIFAALDLAEAKDQCNSSEKLAPDSLEIHRLIAGKLLIALPCGMGAYNYSSLIWIANDKPPYAPDAIEANGDFDAAEGSITSSMKGRGVGDCWWTQTWHFTGKDFALTNEAGDSMCRGFAGGAWTLTSFTARTTTKAPSKALSKKP